MVLRPAVASLAGGSLMRRSRQALFMLICLAVGVALQAQPFATAAAEIRLHQGVCVFVVIAVAALFYWAIFSVHFFVGIVAHTEGGSDLVPGVDRTAAEALTSSPSSGSPLRRFVVLCLTNGALLHAEPLVNAAAGLRIHPGVVAGVILAVTAVFNWEHLYLSFHVARRAAESVHKNPRLAAAPRAASARRSPHLARLSFLFLAALMSLSWFVEPFAAAAELWLSKTVMAVFVLLFAALFSLSVHLFRSFFLPEPPSSLTTAAQRNGVVAITAGAIGTCIATAACVVGASASAYYVVAPARS